MPQWRESVLTVALCLAAATTAGQEIYQEKSIYRNIVVFEDQGLRCMKFGRQTTGRQTCVSLASPDRLVFSYTRMLLGALYLKPDPRNILIIGLGGGSLPSALKKIVPDAKIMTVELDPAVLKVAERFFRFSTGQDQAVAIGDGRVFVKRAKKQGMKYDLIILDAFDHVYVPEHMMTREYLLEVQSLLEPDGVLAANTFSTSRLYDAESATYANVFGSFYNLKTENRVILAANNGLPPLAKIQANADRLEPRIAGFGTGKDWLLPLFSSQITWPDETRLLTDQYSPANLLNGNPAQRP